MVKIPSHLIIAASSWLSKIIIAGVQLLSVKFLLESLGEQHFAVFTLLTGLLIWFSIADVGIGNSLQNYISELKANNKTYDSFIKAAIQVLIITIFCFFVFLFIFSGKLSSLYLSSFGNEIKNNSELDFCIAGILFVLIGVGAVAYKILFAEQLGWLANIINATSYLIGLLGIVIIRYIYPNSSVATALLALYAPVALMSIFYIIYRYFKVWEVHVKLDDYKFLLHRSSGFFIFSILSILVLQADYIVISQKLSALDIVKYTVTMKIFGLIFFIYSAVLQALWPLCAELRIKEQWKKLNRMVLVNITFGILFVCVSTLFVFIFKNQIYGVIAKNIDYQMNGVIFILIALYFSLRVWCDTFAMLLQSMNKLDVLWYLVPCQAIIGAVAQWTLSEKYGIIGVLLGLIISFLFTVFWGLPMSYFFKLKKVVVK